MRRATRRPVGQAHVCRDKIERPPRSRARRTVKLLCYVNFALSWQVAIRRHCDTSSRFRAIGGGLRFIFGGICFLMCRGGYTVVSSFFRSRKGEKWPADVSSSFAVHDCIMDSDRSRNGHTLKIIPGLSI